MDKNTIALKENEVLILVGPSSTGKGWFCSNHFDPTSVLSSDKFRLMVADTDQMKIGESDFEGDGDSDRLYSIAVRKYGAISEDAFELLRHTLSLRTKRNLFTVIDATNLRIEDIEQYVKISKENNVPVSLLVFDIPKGKTLTNDATRENPRGKKRIEAHYRQMNDLVRHNKGRLYKMGIRQIFEIKSTENVEIEFKKSDIYIEVGEGLDVMGDGHGLLKSRIELIEKAGYVKGEDGLYRHPKGRKLVYLNDETSRGSQPLEGVPFGKHPSIAMAWMMKEHVEAGLAYAVDSNHNYKIWRWLEGRDVKMAHGDEKVVEEFEAFEQEHGEEKTKEVKEQLHGFMKSLPSHLVVAQKGVTRAVIAHAGIRDDMIGKTTKEVREYCIYGPTSGIREDGRPNRLDWTKDHKNGILVIWGHEPHMDVYVKNDSVNVDTGGFCGNYLSLLQYPEMEKVQVKVNETFISEEENPIEKIRKNRFDVPNLQNFDRDYDVFTSYGKRHVSASYMKGAIELVSTETAPIEELIYIPPTMSPTPKTSDLPDFLEHPTDAFDYYAQNGVKQVVIEKKHMGSRAVITLFKDEEVGKKYVNKPTLGNVLSRHGVRFFKRKKEKELLTRLNQELKPYFEKMNTELLVLDAEIMPWNLKATGLLKKQYGLVSNVANYKREKHLELLLEYQENRGTDVTEEVEKAKSLLENAQKFHKAFNYFCWNTGENFQGIQIAPFHVLAFSTKTNEDETHVWHMEQAKELASLSDLMIATPYMVVNLESEEEKQKAIEWWLEVTEEGHEGFVVKPMDFIAYGNKGEIIQPAIKTRGREYLRIIYGMDYLIPENLEKLKGRSAGKKMRTANSQFILSLESLKRFINQDTVERIHECVLASLSYGAEPMDPRL